MGETRCHTAGLRLFNRRWTQMDADQILKKIRAHRLACRKARRTITPMELPPHDVRVLRAYVKREEDDLKNQPLQRRDVPFKVLGVEIRKADSTEANEANEGKHG
jgi:hypothetical protein